MSSFVCLAARTLSPGPSRLPSAGRVCVTLGVTGILTDLSLSCGLFQQVAAGSLQFCCQRRQLWILREAGVDVR